MLGFAGLEEFDFILEMKLKSDFDSTLFLVDCLQTGEKMRRYICKFKNTILS